jgi:hypothetical protein
MTIRTRTAILAGIAGLPAIALAQPTNTTLPGGWSWQPVPAQNGTYDTGLIGTARGGGAGQTVAPFTDTSFGVMNETGTPWFTGGDLSAQQYVQKQIFGNFGNPSASGRYTNPGYAGPAGPTVPASGATSANSNFPQTAAERRSLTLNQWSNPKPDAGGVATLNQIVYVPISAQLTVGQGFGGDEMLVKVIGGNSGGQSRFRADTNIDSRWSTSGFGGISNSNNRVNVGASFTVNDAGPGNYDVPWGFNVSLNGNQSSFVREAGFILDQGVNIGAATAGIGANSVGTGLSDTYNVLASMAQNGAPISFTFDASAEVFVQRINGNADARATIGPGMEGNARLIVTWAAYQAIPAPGSVALIAIGAGVIAHRSRRR